MDTEESFNTSLLSGEFPSTTPQPVNSTTPGPLPTTPPAVVKKKFRFRKPTIYDKLPSHQQHPSAALEEERPAIAAHPQQQPQDADPQQQQHRPPPISTQQRMMGAKPKKENGKRIFLVTYSQADTIRFPTRASFARFVINAFNSGTSKAKVVKWAVCLEPHTNGGVHYHVCVKMDGLKHWSTAQRWMAGNGVNVDIQDDHDHYVSMYRYVMKSDSLAVDEEGRTRENNHLQSISSPKTKSCNAANRKRRATATATQQQHRQSSTQQQQHQQSSEQQQSRARNLKLTHVDVGEYVVKNNINNYMELSAAAHQRKEDGEYDLMNYIFNHRKIHVEETIAKAWIVNKAVETVKDDSKSRLDRLEEAHRGDCVSDNCQWYDCALELLRFNAIDPKVYAEALHTCFMQGRGKGVNLLLVGTTNTGKTFMLKPLQQIFGEKLFENPANDKYGWAGIENCQVVLLNDFRYSRDLILWKDLLLLLEGDTVKLPAPKNHRSTDIVLKSTNDIPILASSAGEIEASRWSPNWKVETDMMKSRWRVFTFKHTFEGPQRKDIPPCGHCFAKLMVSF